MAKKKVSRKKSSHRKKAAKKTAGSIRLGEDIWPMERDVFFRPDRLKYVRKMIKPKGCVFCHAAKAPVSFETLCLHKTKYSQVVVNKFPYNSGHVLVLPLRHCGDMLDLSKEEYADLTALVRDSMEALKEVYAPGGMNLGLNHGAVAGAGIPDHLHFHLVPRWGGDLNFFPLIGGDKGRGRIN